MACLNFGRTFHHPAAAADAAAAAAAVGGGTEGAGRAGCLGGALLVFMASQSFQSFCSLWICREARSEL
jgi:hypothetical protein